MADTTLQPLLSENNANADLYNVNLKSNANRSIFDNREKYFDTFQFNKDFDEYIEETTKKKLQNQELLLGDINEIENSKPSIYELSLKEIFTNTQNMWTNIIKHKTFKVDYYFYMAFTIIIVLMIYLFIYFLFLQ